MNHHIFSIDATRHEEMLQAQQRQRAQRRVAQEQAQEVCPLQHKHAAPHAMLNRWGGPSLNPLQAAVPLHQTPLSIDTTTPAPTLWNRRVAKSPPKLMHNCFWGTDSSFRVPSVEPRRYQLVNVQNPIVHPSSAPPRHSVAHASRTGHFNEEDDGEHIAAA